MGEKGLKGCSESKVKLGPGPGHWLSGWSRQAGCWVGRAVFGLITHLLLSLTVLKVIWRWDFLLDLLRSWGRGGELGKVGEASKAVFGQSKACRELSLPGKN